MTTGKLVWATMTRTWSRSLVVAKAANVTAIGRRPAAASPAATPIMFCSAIPIWKKRPGIEVGEQVGPRRVAQISVQDDDAPVMRPQFHYGVSKRQPDIGTIIGHSTTSADPRLFIAPN